MATAELDNKLVATPFILNPVDGLVDPVKKIVLQTEDGSQSSEPSSSDARPFFSYSRPQILFLFKSPLVQAPTGMPELKDWFGDWNEQFATKKDADASATSSSNRDRRFRRDPEDSESTPARPSFRTTLTQPSQMGNFRHQSTRTSDRDRDKDPDKEKDRDRDTKDGRDRLRSLSDKYDRDHPSLTTGSSTIRSRDRERDAAPHLANTTSSRLSTPVSLPAGSRRTEPRDPPKRRNGESSDDWRRGAEPPRQSNDEKSDGFRRDRETRERPRSRARESSRSRRDTSSTRRERDRDDRDRDRDRDQHRDRERPTRGMDHYSPPRDKESNDDPRRWRDDGKREERLAARRERDRDTRERDRPFYDNEREILPDKARDGDRDRWHTTEDSRPKRSSAKDKRYTEDGKDKAEHRDKEREKEKEPAWMETYVPNDAHAGILGGQSAEGELDSIQAWKRGMKEKEEKDKQVAATESKGVLASSAVTPQQQENQMDEIQLFKMLIKREAEKKEVDKQPSSTGLLPSDSAANQMTHRSAADHAELPVSAVSGEHSGPHITAQHSAPGSLTALGAQSASHGLLSVITSGEPSDSPLPSPGQLSSPHPDLQRTTGSRFFPHPIHGESSGSSQKPHGEPLSTSPAPEYLPPQSSRLLALGSRTPSGSSTHPSKPQPSVATNISPGPLQPTVQQLHAFQAQAQSDLATHSQDLQFRLQSDSSFGSNQRPNPVRQQEQFLPFDHGGRGIPFEEKESYAQQYDSHRRTSGMSSISSDSGPYSDLNGAMGNGNQAASFDLPTTGSLTGSYSSGKGSRFAKFFDNKGRDLQMATITKPTGHPSPSPLQGHRQDVNRILMESQGDSRTMEDIFAMLQSSAQGQRINQPSHLGQMPMLGGNSFGQGLSLQHQQNQQHVHAQQNGRLDALYDSRFEDKSFMPDGMVPGLRTASSRNSGGYLPEHLDEQIQFGIHRSLPQHRNGDMFNGNVPQLYPHQQAFVRNAPLQQPPYRGNPSPIASQNPLQSLPQQRLPPGLANLGGRPPHDSTQFFGNTVPLQSGTPHHNGPSQQAFSSYQTSGLGFNATPQMRITPSQPHLQGIVGHGLGHPSNIDVRGPSQAQLLGLRGAGGYSPQQLAQMQAQQVGLRQQQQHQSQNMMQHLPHHLQQPPGVAGGHNQPAQDLMALLMGNSGPHRE